MSAATARDYLWFGGHFPELAEAYCVTLVRGLTPEDLLERLGAVEIRHVTGVDGLHEPAYEPRDARDGDRLFAGVTAVGDWALMVEPNGYLGVTDEIAGPLSQGTTVVSHFRNVNAVDHFTWYEDSELRLHFEPLFAYARDGSDPDGLVDDMRAAGFDLSDGEDGDFDLVSEAAFALAERVTGVRLTQRLLATSEFTGGVVSLPRL